MIRASDKGIETRGMTDHSESMLEHNGEVVAAKAGSVLIETERRSVCGHCSVGDSCATSVIGALFRRRVNYLRLDNSMDLQVGDKVVIGIPEHLLLRAALWAYMVPMLCMIGFASIAATAGHKDLFVFLASIAGLFSGLVLAGMIHTRRVADEIVLLRKQTPTPVMAKVNFISEVNNDE